MRYLQLIGIILVLLLASCNQTQYIEKEVPVEVIKTEYKNEIKYDSVYIHDSIVIRANNDTIYYTKYNTKYKYIYRVDTLIKNDTIPKIVTVTTVEQVNILKWYQKLFCLIGFIGSILLIGYLLIRLKSKQYLK